MVGDKDESEEERARKRQRLVTNILRGKAFNRFFFNLYQNCPENPMEFDSRQESSIEIILLILTKLALFTSKPEN
jgi:hypothetical protein